MSSLAAILAVMGGGAPASPPPSGMTRSVSFGGTGALTLTASPTVLSEMTISILDPELDRAPAPLTVVLVEGQPLQEAEFRIDGVLVDTVTLDSDGYLAPTSINVPAELGAAGSHTLTATQAGSLSASDTFTLARDPAAAPITMGPDAQAVAIPAAIRPNGTRAWVFQDLTPGGLGSWVMPQSPREGTTPYYEKILTARNTTAGKHHVYQGAPLPIEWTFSGIAPDEEFAGKLHDYYQLNRRFYIITNRNEAFKVIIINLDLVPRLQRVFGDNDKYLEAEYIDGHDYTVTALVLDQNWVVPA